MHFTTAKIRITRGSSSEELFKTPESGSIENKIFPTTFELVGDTTFYGTSNGAIYFDNNFGDVLMQVFDPTVSVTHLSSTPVGRTLLTAATDGFRVKIVQGCSNEKVVAFYNSTRKISSLRLTPTLQVLLGHTDGYFTVLKPNQLKCV